MGTENHNQKQPKKILQGFEIDTELDSYDIMPRKEKKREENRREQTVHFDNGIGDLNFIKCHFHLLFLRDHCDHMKEEKENSTTTRLPVACGVSFLLYEVVG